MKRSVRSRRPFLCVYAWIAANAVILSTASAQEATPVQTAAAEHAQPTVYVDCPRCDFGYLRQEVRFVDYVREPELADIHVFITNQGTGSGGQNYVLTFTGQNDFAGLTHVMTYTSSQTDTYNEERSAVTEKIKLGLVPYLLRTPLVDDLSVEVKGQQQAEPEVVSDPWNSWVFDLRSSGSFNLEESNKSYSVHGSAEASRVTESWKLISNVYANYNERRFVEDDTTVASISHRNGLRGRAIKSLTTHWSAGVFSDLYSNTYNNIELGMEVAPAVEYNVFPYSESSRREWVIVYRVEYKYNDYIEETIFLKTEDVLLQQSLGTAVRIRQPWGFVYAGLEGSHYFHDVTKNSVDLYSNLSVRVAKGLSVRFSGGLEIINDQLYLPSGDVSLIDQVLQRQQLATSYELSGSVGLAYTFGSMFNNVVNTRL